MSQPPPRSDAPLGLFARDGALPPPPVPLEPGEQVLWYGRPDTRLIPRWQQWRAIMFGLMGLGLTLALLRALGGPVPLSLWQRAGSWLFTLVVLGGSVALLILPPLADRDHRRRKQYWLTDRRAIIQGEPRAATGLWISRLTPTMPLRRFHRSVRFAWHHTHNAKYRWREGVGFDRIDCACQVYGLMAGLSARPVPPAPADNPVPRTGDPE